MNTARWAAVAVGVTATVGALTAVLGLEADDTSRIDVEPIAWTWGAPPADSWLDEIDVRIDADIDAGLRAARRAGVRQITGRLTAITVDEETTSVVIDGTSYDVAFSAAGWWDDPWTAWLSPTLDLETRPMPVRATLDADGDVVRLRRA